MSICRWVCGWLRLSKLSLAIRIGSTSKKFVNDTTVGGQIIAEEILDSLMRRVVPDMEIRAGRLAKVLPGVVANSYVQAVNYAANKMMGMRNQAQGSGGNARAQIQVPGPDGDTIANWQVLSRRTIMEQRTLRKTKDDGKFFTQTGALKADLVRIASGYVRGEGNAVKVTYAKRLRDKAGRFVKLADTKQRIVLGDLTITLLPNMGMSKVAVMNTANSKFDSKLGFEQKLGFSGEALQKLSGATKGTFVIPGTHRPLLQPAFTYWTLNRIPKLIASAINASLPRNPTSSVNANRISTAAEARAAGAAAANSITSRGGSGGRKGGAQ